MLATLHQEDKARRAGSDHSFARKQLLVMLFKLDPLRCATSVHHAGEQKHVHLVAKSRAHIAMEGSLP